MPESVVRTSPADNALAISVAVATPPTFFGTWQEITLPFTYGAL